MAKAMALGVCRCIMRVTRHCSNPLRPWINTEHCYFSLKGTNVNV